MLLNFLLMNMYDFPSTNCLNLIVRLLTLLKMLDLMLLKMRATYGHTVSAPTVRLTVKSAPLSTPKGRQCRHLHTLADGALPESQHTVDLWDLIFCPLKYYFQAYFVML